MRALVTGHSGFVGRHMVRALEERGFSVYGADISGPTIRSHYPVDAADYFNRRWSGMVYDLVVHCAYNVGGRAAIDGINMNLARNMILDGALFDWAVRSKQKAVMYFSSSAAYPAHLQQKYCGSCDDAVGWNGPYKLHEDDINFNDDHLGPPDADYGLAKICGERMARAAANNGLRVHILRPFSGCSGSQSFDYPWPSIAKRAKDGDYSVWGVPGQSRDWVDILDVTNAALAVYDADERRPVNICSGVGTEMGDLMKMFAKKFHSNEPEVQYLTDKPMGVYSRVGDPQRMNEHYTIKKDLEQMIDETVSQMQN